MTKIRKTRPQQLEFRWSRKANNKTPVELPVPHRYRKKGVHAVNIYGVIVRLVEQYFLTK